MEGVDQPAQTDQVMVAALFDKYEAGETFQSLPLHLTYVSWFDLPIDQREEFYTYVEDVALENRAPVVTGGSLQYFTGKSPDEAAPVRRLDVPTAGFNVVNDFAPHAALFRYAKSIDPNFDDTYFGLDWKPHVSPVEGREFQQNEVAQLEHLAIFRKDIKLGRKVIDHVYRWGIVDE